MIRHFNIGMREYFEAGHCGPGHVVDVFNMTDALVSNEDVATEAPALTHDGVHWSAVVNLLKVRLNRHSCVEVTQVTCKCCAGARVPPNCAVGKLKECLRMKRGTETLGPSPMKHAALCAPGTGEPASLVELGKLERRPRSCCVTRRPHAQGTGQPASLVELGHLGRRPRLYLTTWRPCCRTHSSCHPRGGSCGSGAYRPQWLHGGVHVCA